MFMKNGFSNCIFKVSLFSAVMYYIISSYPDLFEKIRKYFPINFKKKEYILIFNAVLFAFLLYFISYFLINSLFKGIEGYEETSQHLNSNISSPRSKSDACILSENNQLECPTSSSISEDYRKINCVLTKYLYDNSTPETQSTAFGAPENCCSSPNPTWTCCGDNESVEFVRKQGNGIVSISDSVNAIAENQNSSEKYHIICKIQFIIRNVIQPIISNVQGYIDQETGAANKANRDQAQDFKDNLNSDQTKFNDYIKILNDSITDFE